MITQPELHLKNFTFKELLTAQGLARLDQYFLEQLSQISPQSYQDLLAYRFFKKNFSAIEISELLINCAIFLEHFLAEFFHIEEAVAASQLKTTENNPIAIFKKFFILRRAKKELNRADTFPSFAELHIWLQTALKINPLQTEDMELAVALLGNYYLTNPISFEQEIEKLVKWCTQALLTPDGQAFVKDWSSFRIPDRIDFANLIKNLTPTNNLNSSLTTNQLRLREGFNLTDERMDARSIQDEVNYCIYCHDHEGDFCSKGFPVKKGDSSQGFKKNPLNVLLTGCPLEEKISEMHYLKKNGHTIAALIMIMVDNAMCPATGHRICNDCMKACIYQKQVPVNIPQVETRILTDVLALPWGVEIYDLLTRWHPLRQSQWQMKPYNGFKIMIAGMGPAGFTLAHHLLLEGFAVVGFDGLKIEPLINHLVEQPIYQFADLNEKLSERLMAGFGGVAEYGITARWDKNFLKLIYLSLMRKPHFQVFGGVRFGGTITTDDVWKMGFDHFVIAVGAGLPKALPIPNSLAPGMRQANDFLMALQLGNAAKFNSITSLQIRLPAIVIGGGLTGIDTATEVQAYYITLVEKIYHRYHILIKNQDEKTIFAQFNSAAREILTEYLEHGLAVYEERRKSAALGKTPNFIHLIHRWGGVTIAYRRSMQESPAYIHNHEELQKALEEGVFYLEAVEPKEVKLNQFGHTQTLICFKRYKNADNKWMTSEEIIALPANTILVATGTQPNTAYEFEHKGTFNRLHSQYQHYEEINNKLVLVDNVLHCKDPNFGPFTSYDKNDQRISLIGDTHPVFHGSVVKAIASGMRTYPKIVKLLQNKIPARLTISSLEEYKNFSTEMKRLFLAKIISISRKNKNTLELKIQAPIAAHHYNVGQFYRLQNFERFSLRIHETSLQMEPLALTAAGCDQKNGILQFFITEKNASEKLCATLQPNEYVSLMGPTGVRTKIPTDQETILIIGNVASFSFLLSYGKALRSLGHRLFFLGYFNNKDEVYCQTEIEEVTHTIIWLTENEEIIHSTRSTDLSLKGKDIVKALLEYSKIKKENFMAAIDRIFLIGNLELLRYFQKAHTDLLNSYFTKNPKIIGSVYGNMQCMLKGVCAQCLQWQIDPKTGRRTKAVFACSWQDQPLEIIDIDHLESRYTQNHLLDQLNNLWIDYLFQQFNINRI